MPLLEPDPQILRPTATGSPAHDRVADRRAFGTPNRCAAN